MKKKITITGGIVDFAKGMALEAKYQVFGRPKKKKNSGGSSIQIHYHFYKEKKPRQDDKSQRGKA